MVKMYQLIKYYVLMSRIINIQMMIQFILICKMIAKLFQLINRNKYQINKILGIQISVLYKNRIVLNHKILNKTIRYNNNNKFNSNNYQKTKYQINNYKLSFNKIKILLKQQWFCLMFLVLWEIHFLMIKKYLELALLMLSFPLFQTRLLHLN